jgi:hypothetical protein
VHQGGAAILGGNFRFRRIERNSNVSLAKVQEESLFAQERREAVRTEVKARRNVVTKRNLNRGTTAVFSACLLLMCSTAAIAADSCTGWYTQSDGSTWRECTDSNGNVYCTSCPANGGACERVPCR